MLLVEAMMRAGYYRVSAASNCYCLGGESWEGSETAVYVVEAFFELQSSRLRREGRVRRMSSHHFLLVLVLLLLLLLRRAGPLQ